MWVKYLRYPRQDFSSVYESPKLFGDTSADLKTATSFVSQSADHSIVIGLT